MTSLVFAAPGGASIPGTEMAGPPGCASGTGGRSNRSRSRPGWSLGGTICAPGGTTCATAANETLTIAKAAAMARTHESMPPTLDERAQILRYGETRSQCRQLSCFGNSSRCFKKVTPASAMLQVAGCRGPGDSGGAGGLSSLSYHSGPARYTSREVNRGDVGVDVDARQQAIAHDSLDMRQPCQWLPDYWLVRQQCRCSIICRRL